MRRKAPLPAVVLVLAAVIAVALMGAVLALADGDSSPPECPPGLVCEWPTATAPSPTSEPYPPPYLAPYPAPEYLPIVVRESYP